jgi:hypothetical protein
MGVWDTDLFADDVACDIRDHYRQLLEDGVEDGAAARQTLEEFASYFAEPDGIAPIAFAVTQSRVGRLDPDIRDRALALIDAGADLRVWEQENPKLVAKRRAALERARAQLTGPQPARRRLRPPKREVSGLAAGDVLALALPGRLALLRVVRVKPHRLGETPVLEELDFDGAELPSRDVLEQLKPKVTDPISLVRVPFVEVRFSAFVMQGIDWQRAGFQKVRTIAPREGDEQAPLPSAGISWAELAARYRRQSTR